MKFTTQQWIIAGLILVLTVSIAINVYTSSRNSELSKDIKYHENQEQTFKNQANTLDKVAQLYRASSSQWKSKYDSSFATQVALKKIADKYKTNYENALSHPVHFSNNQQRDSALKVLYPK